MKKGVTLAETTISLFILAAAFTVIAALLHSSLSWQGRIEQRALAAQLAKKRLAELRAWARTHIKDNEWNYDHPLAEWETTLPSTDPDYPGLELVVKVVDQTLFSPNSTIEAPWEGLGVARRMNRSAKRVKVTARDPADPSGAVSLVTLVCDPTRQMGEVVLEYTQPTGPLAPASNIISPSAGSWVDFSVRAIAPDGTDLHDLFFDWYTVPLGGNGTPLPSRDGRTCRMINGVRTGWPPGVFGVLGTSNTSGQVVVAVHGQYRGQGQPPQDYNYLLGSPYIKISVPPIELQ